MRTDHPYTYEPDLLKRYPRATVELTNDEVIATQTERNKAADQRLLSIAARLPEALRS